MSEPVTVTPRAKGFQTDLVYEEAYPGTDRPFVTCEELVFRQELGDGAMEFVVDRGFRYDRASVPTWGRWLVPQSVLDYGAAVHDLLYRSAFDKDVADRLFYLIVRAEGQAGRLRGRLAWRAVQVGGWPSWIRSWRARRGR